MILEIITPEKVFFKDEVDLVRVPGTKGSFGMKQNHAPIISSLEPGILKIIQGSDERYFQLFDKAIVEQHKNHITIIIAGKIEETYPIFVR